MMRFLKNPLFLVSLVIGVIVAGYFVYRERTATRPEARYMLDTVTKGDVTQSVSANGTLNPVILVNVGTQVSGIVKKLYVNFNDRVKQGQVLLELDDSLLAAQARQSQANVSNASAALDLAQANEQRTRSLFSQEYVSRQELDQAVQVRKSAQAQLELAKAQVQRDRVNLSYAVIHSPVSGVVVDRVVDVGQTVAASFQTPTLIKIAQDLSKMQIDTSFAEADVGNIRVGQVARFNVDAFPNRSFKGAVQQIRLNPTTQQNVVTYDVVISVDNADQTLLPGMTAYVNVVVAQRKDVLLVPNAALRYKPPEAVAVPADARGKPSRKRDMSSGVVYVLENGSLKPVNLVLGITDNRNTEVVGGELNPGGKIVVGENQPTASQQPASTIRFRPF